VVDFSSYGHYHWWLQPLLSLTLQLHLLLPFP
jgi:hypothetical protein